MNTTPKRLMALFLCLFAMSGAHSQTLSGTERLACEAILCLSSSFRPGECSQSLSRYFDIRKYHKGALDWGATIDARQAFLGMCPQIHEAPGMSARISAIANGAGRCDAEYLNARYAGTSYRYKVRRGFLDGDRYYDISTIKTVTQSTLPGYCVVYNNHAWTYELSIKYVGEPLKGGYWVPAARYVSEQRKWENSQTTQGWHYSWERPENQGSSGYQY